MGKGILKLASCLEDSFLYPLQIFTKSYMVESCIHKQQPDGYFALLSNQRINLQG